MCGICGLVNYRGISATDKTVVDRMSLALTHRGPDDNGLYDDEFAILAHRRLSIIDLSTNARQPMSSEDGSIWLTFNGEIYNFHPLRELLEQKGHIFRSNSDTEVILHLYEQVGESFVNFLNGMFAFALWDKRNNKLILARDRLGVKPLLYSMNENSIVFSSELKALLADTRIDREIDFEGLELFFTYNFIPAPWSIYKGIKKLEPAHYLVFDKTGYRINRYWDILPSLEQSDLTDDMEAASEQLRQLVKDATRIRMISDVPLGAFLSGGIDSAVVVANMAMLRSEPIRTFFIKYSDNPLFDESRYARAVAELYGTKHTEIELSPSEGLKSLDEVMSAIDEPFADSSAIPTWLVSKWTRRSVTVALSGDGGDEVFGGYRRYLGEVFVDYYMKLPHFFRKKLIEHVILRLPDSKNRQFLEYIRRLKIFLEGASRSQVDRHYYWLVYFPDSDRYELFKEEIRANFNGAGLRVIERLYENPIKDRINRMLYADIKNLLPFDMLTKVDLMSMSNSLEIRSPFLDYRISELAFRFCGSLKIRGLRLKHILKEAFRNYLPPALLNRPKQGFEVPVGEWLRSKKEFKRLFWEVVEGPNIDRQGLFKADKIRQMFQEHEKSRRDNSHKLWAIFVFQWWFQSEYGPS